MTSHIRKTALPGRFLTAAAATLVASVLPLSAAAQQRPAADLDQHLEYAQCIRANGFAEYPDPSPDGRMNLRIGPENAGKFETARGACRDKMPAGMAIAQEPPTRERMELLLEFADCMREQGIAEFPDPLPDGSFELRRTTTDASSPRIPNAMETCRKTNPVTGIFMKVVQ